MNVVKERYQRPNWESMFLYEAYHWSKRSHDQHTKCGCIFVKDKTVISHGYNGFIREVDDSKLPLVREKTLIGNKYDFMIHAEQNAIFNCARNGISCRDTIAYVTGEPCTDCLQYMYQAGIVKVVYSDFNYPTMLKNEEYKKRWNQLINLMYPKLTVKFIPRKLLNYE